jgi:hypothetical protein
MDYETPTKNRNRFGRTETIKGINTNSEIKIITTEMKNKTYMKL